MISSKKKFLITGAGGFVGYHLTTYFSNLGHKVFASFRNKKPKFDNDKIKLVKLNLPYTSGLDFEYDCLIHCGADTTATTNNEKPIAILLLPVIMFGRPNPKSDKSHKIK